MTAQEKHSQEHPAERFGPGFSHFIWALSLSVLMFGLGFLAGSRWAERRAAESERVVVGRPVPPQVEVSLPEQEGSGAGDQDGRLWNILTGQESPSAVLPPLPTAKQGREQSPQVGAQTEQHKASGGPSSPRSVPESLPRPGLAPPSAVQSPTTPSASTLQGGGSRYAVQVISVQTREKAEAVVRELNGRGYPLVRVVSGEVPGRGTWYRVWVGSFARKEQAESLRRQIQERERLQPQLVSEKGP